MKPICALPVWIVALVAASAGCQSTEGADGLAASATIGGVAANAVAANTLGAGQFNTPNHFLDPNLGQHGLADPQQVQVQIQKVGSPEAVARLHGCSKLTYASLGAMLTSRGVDLTRTDPGSAGELYAAGASALGVAIYSGRVPEAILGSTASLAKQMDIFVAAAGEMLANQGGMPACPNTALLDSLGNFTSDGIACVLGKPSNQDYLTLANQTISEASDQATGQQIALSALLEAAHTCE
jgi:hypothetical protein